MEPRFDPDTRNEPLAGDTVVGTHCEYVVVQPRGFAHTLHTARIAQNAKGNESNAGIAVILTRKKLVPAGLGRWR